MRQTGDYGAMQLIVRTALRGGLGSRDSHGAAAGRSEPAVREFVTFQDLVDRSVSPRRLLVLLLAGFAAFALILASLGIYAVISYSSVSECRKSAFAWRSEHRPRSCRVAFYSTRSGWLSSDWRWEWVRREL